jgi:hypothetical protein
LRVLRVSRVYAGVTCLAKAEVLVGGEQRRRGARRAVVLRARARVVRSAGRV